MHSHLAKMLGQYIKEIRQKKNILQKDLAFKLQISSQFLGRIERGEVMAPINLLRTIITILELNQSRLNKIYRNAGTKTAKDLFNKSRDTFL